MSPRTKKIVGALLLAVLLALLSMRGPVRSWMLFAVAGVQGMGAGGAVLFAMMYVLATVAILPASLLTIAAGVLYGPLWAALLVLASSLTGATIAFTLARTWLRPWAEARFSGSTVFRAVSARTAQDGAKLVFLLRLSPLVPFSILNYFLGLTSLSARAYILASAIGMVPGILLYTYIGSTLGTLGALSGRGVSQSSIGSVFFWFGLAATLVVTIVLARWSSQALATEKTGETDSGSAG